MADEIAERPDLGSPPLGRRAGRAALDAGLVAVELEGLDEVDPPRHGRCVLGERAGFREVVVPRRPGQVDRDLPPRLDEHRQEPDPIRLGEIVAVAADELIQRLFLVFALLIGLLRVPQMRAPGPFGSGRRIADQGSAALFVDDALQAAEIPVGHAPRGRVHLFSGAPGGPEAVLPVPVQLEAELVAPDLGRLEVVGL